MVCLPGSFRLTLLPLGVFTLRHPGALGERFKFVTTLGRETPQPDRHSLRQNYVENSFKKMACFGDPEPRHHFRVWEAGLSARLPCRLWD